MILSEENLNDKDLSEKIAKTIIKLDNEIKNLKNKVNMTEQEKGSEELKVLTDDLQNLVQISRTVLSKRYVPKNLREISNKINRIWEANVYPKIQEYNSLLKEYKNFYPNSNLRTIEIRTGNKIFKSIKTEIFNY
jgi:hypothetical protein